MSHPTAMKLILPKDTDDPGKTPVKVSDVLTILPGKNDQVYYYERNEPTQLKTSNFKAIRDVILDKKRRTDPVYFYVILKPSRDANYKNIVDILDEMTIDAIRHYALVDISSDEYKIIQATELANGIK